MALDIEELKKHLVSLLLLQYNQEELFEDLSWQGIDLFAIKIEILEIILDIVGFPEDTSVEYEIAHNPEYEGSEFRKEDYPAYFERNYLFEKYDDTKLNIENHESMHVSENKLELVTGGDGMIVNNYLSEYIDWLYEEKERLNRE